MKPQPEEVSLRDVLAEVAKAIPPDVHPNIIIIGSLAAGYGLFHRLIELRIMLLSQR